jgi:hypothetical protein
LSASRSIDEGTVHRDVSVDQLKPYVKNPRKNKAAVKLVANSITDTGYNSPIVVDEDWVILAGHTRYFAIKTVLKWAHIPFVVQKHGLSEDQKRLYRLADNSTGEVAEWDKGLLLEELEALGGRFELNDYNIPKLDEADKADEEHHDDNCDYPLVPKFSENYDAVVVFCTNEIDFNHLQEVLQLEKVRSYKTSGTGTTRVVSFARFKECISKMK